MPGEVWTTEAYHEYLRNRAKKKTKYNNQKVEYNGFVFDSKREYNRYLILLSMEQQGEIADLEVHPKFHLLDSKKWHGQTIPKKSYSADFRYTQNGRIIVEDVKSPATQKDKTYRLKRHLFLVKHPNVDFYEV